MIVNILYTITDIYRYLSKCSGLNDCNMYLSEYIETCNWAFSLVHDLVTFRGWSRCDTSVFQSYIFCTLYFMFRG